MFSEALRILDRNTVQYMVDDMAKQIDEQKAALREKDTALQEKDITLREQQAEIERLKKLLYE